MVVSRAVTTESVAVSDETRNALPVARSGVVGVEVAQVEEGPEGVVGEDVGPVVGMERVRRPRRRRVATSVRGPRHLPHVPEPPQVVDEARGGAPRRRDLGTTRPEGPVV